MDEGFGEFLKVQFGQGELCNHNNVGRNGGKIRMKAEDFEYLATETVSLDSFWCNLQAYDGAETTLFLAVWEIFDGEELVSVFFALF